MIVWEYDVYDPLSNNSLLSVLFGPIEQAPIKVYAKDGEHGLTEDYLIEKGYQFTEPKRIEVDDDFNGYFIIQTIEKLREVDLAKDSGRIIVKPKPIEPSLN